MHINHLKTSLFRNFLSGLKAFVQELKAPKTATYVWVGCARPKKSGVLRPENPFGHIIHMMSDRENVVLCAGVTPERSKSVG